MSVSNVIAMWSVTAPTGVPYPPKFINGWPAAINNAATPVPSVVWTNNSGGPVTIDELTATIIYPGASWGDVVFQVYRNSQVVPALPGSGLIGNFNCHFPGLGFERFVKAMSPPLVLAAGEQLTVFLGCYSGQAYGPDLELTFT